MSEFYAFIATCPQKLLDAAARHAAEVLPTQLRADAAEVAGAAALLYADGLHRSAAAEATGRGASMASPTAAADGRAIATRKAQERVEADELEAAVLTAKKAAAESATESRAESSVRISFKVHQILGHPDDSHPDRKDELESAVERHRRRGLDVKAAEAALSAARNRYKWNVAQDDAAAKRAANAKVDRGSPLQHLDADMRSDKSVALMAVGHRGDALQFCSTALRGDKDVALAAVSNDGHALRFVNDALLHDYDVAMAAFPPSKQHASRKVTRKSVEVQAPPSELGTLRNLINVPPP